MGTSSRAGVPSSSSGETEPLATAGGELVPRSRSCRWCRLVETKANVVTDETAFVVLAPGADRDPTYLTLVPKTHVAVVSELPPAEMAVVLGGLTSASELLRRTVGAPGVRIRPYPKSPQSGGNHLRFRLVPELAPAKRPGKARAAKSSFSGARGRPETRLSGRL